MRMNFGKSNEYFNRAFGLAEKLDYDHAAIVAINEVMLDRNEVVSYRDFKDRRVILYWTEFGNFAITEDGTDYVVAYVKGSPLGDLVPWFTLDAQSVMFVCGCNTEVNSQPNICGRVNMLIESIKNYYED